MNPYVPAGFPYMGPTPDVGGITPQALQEAVTRGVALAIGNMNGGNPFGANPRPAKPSEVFGQSGSGFVSGKDPDEETQVLTWGIPNVTPEGFSGNASIHVFQRDVEIYPFDAQNPPNGMLVADISWQTGNGGGEVRGVDITRGSFFTVSGFTSIVLRARMISSILDAPLVPYASKRIEAVCNWGTSISPKSAKITLPSVPLVQNAPTIKMKIPQQAESMIVQTDNPALLPSIQARFYNSDGATAPIAWIGLNPNANGQIECHGAEFVDFISTQGSATRIFPVFELYL